MARRVVNASMLEGLVEGSMNQEVQKGAQRSIDPAFPVFSTPINQDIIVYIPTVNCVQTENGTVMNVLPSVIHDGKLGKVFTNVRCINGLSGNPLFEQLGYDGTCPACEAVGESWDLYNLKMKAEAKKIGIDPQNDPGDVLKPFREKFLQEMDLKSGEEYVTFPIVIIPTQNKVPTPDALQNLQVVYVHWRKKRYEDAILGGLESMMTNPGHPAGLFWHWKFTYDTKGKPATARDSAKNAKYTVIQDQQYLATLEQFRQAAEEKAKPFTLIKAAEVVVANQFLFREDLENEVNKIMRRTRELLALAETNGGNALPAGQQQGALPGANPLATYGTAQPQGAQAPATMGVEQPQAQPQAQLQGQPQGQPQFGGAPANPVGFGTQG